MVAAAQTDRYLKVFEPRSINPAEAILFEDFEDPAGFRARGNASYWGIAPLTGTRNYPSRFAVGGHQSGKIFYGAQGYDSSATMTIEFPDLTTYTDLRLTVSLAAPTGVWEGSQKDSLIISGSSGTIDSFLPSGNRAALTSRVHLRNLGFEFQDFTYAIESSLESLTFRFASTGDDETIGIDSVMITGDALMPQLGPVPEPSTLVLLSIGASMAASSRRRRCMAAMWQRQGQEQKR